MLVYRATFSATALVTYLNNAAVKMLGWTQDELDGRSMHELIHFQAEDGTLIPEKDCELLKVRLEGRTVRSEDDAFTCKDGSLLPVALSAAPLLGESAGHGTVVVFRDTTNERSERDRVKRELAALTWVGRIREALDEDRLVLYSQPIVSLHGDQSSEELLLRMLGRHNEVIAPSVFLGVAEKYGLIAEIDRWVVRQAIQLASKGRRVGANLSAESIIGSDLLTLIEREIQESNADPSNLVFEITETALMKDIGMGEAFARGVVDLGCSLALDDFGTGYGTFTYLKKLPITFLKIDIEFVSDLCQSAANQHVVKAIVNLAQGFGCRTVAEGVEDRGTLQLLHAFGVDYAQGFYMGIPRPIWKPWEAF